MRITFNMFEKRIFYLISTQYALTVLEYKLHTDKFGCKLNQQRYMPI